MYKKYIILSFFLIVFTINTVTALESALSNIGRTDVVEKCNFAEIGHYQTQKPIHAESNQQHSNYF